MNTGGEAADQMVRMMLSGGEVAVRLSGSAIKNLAAISLALAQNHKTLSGKVRFGRMLRETRDLRLFPMSAEQYSQFRRLARRQKILYAAVKGRDGGAQVDLILPATDVERANQVFARMLYAGPQPEPAQEKGAHPPKKERRSGRDSRDTGRGSATRRTAADRPSVEARLKHFRQSQQRQSAPARAKSRTRMPERSK